MQPRPRPRPRPTNDMAEAARMQEERFRQRGEYAASPALNDEFGYGRPQQPVQQQPTVVPNTSGQVRQYSPQDFINMDLNNLKNLQQKGQILKHRLIVSTAHFKSQLHRRGSR